MSNEAPNEEVPNEKDASGRRAGRWAERDPHGGTVVGTYLEGKRTGEWMHYFGDGRLRPVSNYAAGSLTGPATWYRATGGLLQRGGFIDGEKHGFWQRWNAAGATMDEGDFDHGSKTGQWTYFNPDGTVKRTTVHRGPAT
ncbi:antitoxin component YwqK of YwqJK toxin-antitoxin module [Arthrobacter sp. PL16]|uniref:toxin-antitoxin system YwqK family antitoxin n=1 Tax=Arthrobacter sp. PL16 TaxID=3071720 RepID=UPI002E07AD45|nr:antitoxin component YwqK of YwqJK toxin-antitoxin module [Arthrobacter sp. PL16]